MDITQRQITKIAREAGKFYFPDDKGRKGRHCRVRPHSCRAEKTGHHSIGNMQDLRSG